MGAQKYVFAILISGAFACGAYAQITKTKDGYLFRAKYTAGQTMMYDSSSSHVEKGGDAKNVMVPIMFKVIAVSNGIATAKLEFGAGRLAKSSKQVTDPGSVTVHLNDNDLTALGGSSFPRHAIPIGTTWWIDRPVSPYGIGEGIDTLYRFAGISTVDGNQVAVITYQLSGFAQGSGTMMLLTSYASIYRNETILVVSSIDKFTKLRTVMTRKPLVKVKPLPSHSTR